VLGVRPENLRIAEHGPDLDVDVVEELGADAYVYGRLVTGSEMLVARVDFRHPPARGDRIRLAPIDADALHVFSATTGTRLG